MSEEPPVIARSQAEYKMIKIRSPKNWKGSVGRERKATAEGNGELSSKTKLRKSCFSLTSVRLRARQAKSLIVTAKAKAFKDRRSV